MRTSSDADSVSSSEDSQDFDTGKSIDRIADWLYAKDRQPPKRRLRREFRRLMATLHAGDEALSQDTIRRTWFRDFPEWYTDMVGVCIRMWTQLRRDGISDILEFYVLGLPDFAFNYVKGGQGCLFYSLLCSQVCSVDKDGELGCPCMLQTVLEKTLSDALRARTASGDTVLKAFFRICTASVIHRKRRDYPESDLVGLALWPEILSKSDPTDIYNLVRSEFRKLPSLEFARFFSPALSRLAAAGVDYQRFLTRHSVVELALFPFEDQPCLHRDHQEVIRMLCAVKQEAAPYLSPQQVEKWLQDHEGLFPGIVDHADADPLRSSCLRDVVRWLLSGGVTIEAVLDHVLVPGRFGAQDVAGSFIRAGQVSEQLAGDTARASQEGLVRILELCLSRYSHFSSLFSRSTVWTHHSLASTVLELYWQKNSAIECVFDSLTKTVDAPDSIRSKNLFDLATYSMANFSTEQQKQFCDRFEATPALWALQHPLWSAKLHTDRLLQTLQNASDAGLVGVRLRGVNIVSALLEHGEYRGDLAEWTCSGVRHCIGLALKSMSNADYRSTYNKHPDFIQSLDFSRKMLGVTTAGDVDLSCSGLKVSKGCVRRLGNATAGQLTTFIRNECAVCLVEMVPPGVTNEKDIAKLIQDRDLARAPCGHWFHQKCLLECARRFDRCPTCATSFFLL